MYQYVGRFIKVSELSTENDVELFDLMKAESDDYQNLIFHQNVPSNYSDFVLSLKSWFSNGRAFQFLIYSKTSDSPIGTFFFYSYNKETCSVKLSIYLRKESRKSCTAAESMGVAIGFASEILGVKSLYFSVYSANTHMLEVLRKAGLQEKGSHEGSKGVFDYEMSMHDMTIVINKLAKLQKLR